jgi:hypothetical protein
VAVVKLGPKEARVELVGLPLLAIPYFCHGYRGVFAAAVELFCERVYVSDAHAGDEPRATFRLSWV